MLVNLTGALANQPVSPVLVVDSSIDCSSSKENRCVPSVAGWLAPGKGARRPCYSTIQELHSRSEIECRSLAAEFLLFLQPSLAAVFVTDRFP